MDLIAKERDRLLQRTARVYGLSFTLVSLVCLAIPGAVDMASFFVCLPLYLVIAFCQYRIGSSRSMVWAIPIIIAGLGIVGVVTLLAPEATGDAGVSAVAQLAAASMASTAIVLTTGLLRRLFLGGSSLVTLGVTTFLLLPFQPFGRTFALIVLGWVLATIIGFWISAGVPQAARRIASIGRAHRAER
ncbi:MAG: histidine kinase, partial [Actinobacteria bacterium]|nr:histidine kinase [Actinomycetota bacterium]